MWGRMTAEKDIRRKGHDSQVSSDRDRGERRRDGQGESNDASEGWSGGSKGDSVKETEEDRMTARDPEGSGDTLTALPWVTQESGAGALQVGARADGSNTRKAPSAVADEAGARGHYGARPTQGEKNGSQRENAGGITLGVRVNLTPPPTPWRPSPGFSATTEASWPPSPSPTPWYSWSTMEASRLLLLPRTPKVIPPAFSRWLPFFSPCVGLAP